MDITNATELYQSDNVNIGDVLIFQYTILGVCTDLQIASIITKLLEQPFIIQEYEIIKHNWFSDYLQIKIKVVDNPLPIAVIIAAVAAACISVFIYLSLDKIYKIGTEPTGNISKWSTTFLLIISGAVLFIIFKIIKVWKS